MYKQKPKSCSCSQCTRGKHTKGGHTLMKADERSFRHEAKIELKKGNYEIVTVVPIGNYYD